MASNKPPIRKLAGIRSSCPSGYILGRLSAGEGDVELLTMAKLQSGGLIPVTLPPSGAAGGDLGGTYPNPKVVGLQTRAVSASAPSNLDVLAWSTGGSAWAPLHLGAVAYTNSYLDLANLPPLTGGTAGQVLTKIDGTDYNFHWAAGGGSSGAPASIQDTGTGILLAVSDASGQLVLDGSGDPIFAPEVFPLAAIPTPIQPTIQTFTAIGAITWNRPAGCVRIEVEIEAPGGGSPGVHTSGATAGGDASDAIFNGVNAGGGKGGATSGAGGLGGRSVTGATTKRFTGVDGGFAIMLVWTSTNFIIIGGQGGGGPSSAGGGSGAAGVAGNNYGQGAAGACLANASQASLAAFNFSGGGGQGERVLLVINNPAASYSGTITDGGAAGTGTTFNGAKGGQSRITVREFYS